MVLCVPVPPGMSDLPVACPYVPHVRFMGRRVEEEGGGRICRTCPIRGICTDTSPYIRIIPICGGMSRYRGICRTCSLCPIRPGLPCAGDYPTP